MSNLVAEEENAAELKIGNEFLKAKCLMNGEVALILDSKHDLQYLKRFSRYQNQGSLRQVRETLSRYRLAEFELCVLGNLCPETVEEAIALVPSLTSRERDIKYEDIENMLKDLSVIKRLLADFEMAKMRDAI